jgi:hypothetical protein
MSRIEARTLEELAVPQELQDRAKILWGVTALWGVTGWVLCKFLWKLPGQEDSAWFQRQLKQAMFVGIAGWVGYMLCGVGWLLHLGLGAMGFLAINKGEDYSAPLFAGMVDKDAPALEGAGRGERPQAPDPTTQEQALGQQLLEPIEGVAYQTWAWAWAHISQGHPVDDIIGRVSMQRAVWDRIHPQWQQRMAQDASQTILREFQQYIAPPAQAVPQQQAQAVPQQRAQAVPQQQAQAAPAAEEPEPAPLERWVEVAVALEIAQEKGWDTAQLLTNFGMSDQDWARVNAWWSLRFRSSTRDKAFIARYEQLQDYYRSYYASR